MSRSDQYLPVTKNMGHLICQHTPKLLTAIHSEFSDKSPYYFMNGIGH